MVADFWGNRPLLRPDSEEENTRIQSSIGAQIAIHSTGSVVPPYRIVLDLDSTLNPSAKITYQAIRPNNSEIFSIMQYGTLEDLMKALESKTASLTDRDEEGCSLLNVSQVASSHPNRLTIKISTLNTILGLSYCNSCSRTISTLTRSNLI